MADTLPAGHFGPVRTGAPPEASRTLHCVTSPTRPGPAIAGAEIAFLSWRDTSNPEGGGAERALEQVAEGLVRRGARVTVFSAAYPGALAEEHVRGVRYVRRGSKLSVYVRGMQSLASGLLGRPDVVVDVQNGLPFFTRAVTRRPIVVWCHHVHREQWPVVYPGRMGTVGWWIEGRLAPRLYRRSRYVTGSHATRAELAELGVDPRRIAVIHYGTDRARPVQATRTEHPSVCVVGRLVPHKQVEHAIDAVLELREREPALRDLTLTVVGSGWWEETLHAYARERRAGDAVHFLGQVDEETKERVYEESWVLALPSLKEGWGLVVGEAARAGTPTVAYAEAGGTRESIVDGVSGLLAGDRGGFVAALAEVLTDDDLRKRLADGATVHGGQYTWERTRADFAALLEDVLARRRP
jgi:glycosyltransferase involved in cell wall biosynthesis